MLTLLIISATIALLFWIDDQGTEEGFKILFAAVGVFASLCAIFYVLYL